MKTTRRVVLSSLCAVFLLLVFTTHAHACQCIEYDTPVCAQYARASAVFTVLAMAIDQKPDQNGAYAQVAKVHFVVEEVFKGTVDKDVFDTQGGGADCKITYEVGKRYLIFDYGYDSKTRMIATSYCGGSTSVESALEELNYLRDRLRGKQRPAAIGKVVLGKYDPVVGAKVTIKGEGEVLRTTTGAKGDFSFELKRPGQYEVSVVVPFSAGPLEYEGEEPRIKSVDSREKQTTLRYETYISLGSCSYKQIDLFPVDLKATGEINGTIVDSADEPVSDLTVYLYPATPDQQFSSGDYEFASTNKAGLYKFEGLKAGDYFLGINLGRSPDVANPYPTTFYPGVADSKQARIVHVGTGKVVNGIDVRLSNRLVEREIRGVMLWPDGTPVSQLAPGAKIGPLLSIRDPEDLRFPLDSRRSDGSETETTNEKGEFSFIGFEGYSYVIHVHAFNAKNEVFHAKHVKITVGEKNPFLRLVLSVPGHGGSDDEITKELKEP